MRDIVKEKEHKQIKFFFPESNIESIGHANHFCSLIYDIFDILH